MPTLNEAASVENTLQSLRYQNILTVYPEHFELVVVDSESDDGTAEIASALADKVIMAPRGKLTAIDYALNQLDSDVIVAVDGDSYYGCNFLNLLARHFENPEVVGVSGVEIYNDSRWPFLAGMLLEQYIFRVTPRMMGRGAAYKREAYFTTGGFDLDIDQKSITQMVAEEEVGFHRRLTSIGKVERDYRISVVTSARRLLALDPNFDRDRESTDRF